MSDDTKKPDETAARAAILRAIHSPPPSQDATPTTMDQRAAAVLQQSLAEQQIEDERARTRWKVFALHAACAALMAGAIILRVTLLSQYPALGELLIEGVLFVWGIAGFKPSEAVLARIVAKLEPKRLERMLSLRPPAYGNSLHPPPRPGIPQEVVIPPAPPPPTRGQS